MDRVCLAMQGEFGDGYLGGGGKEKRELLSSEGWELGAQSGVQVMRAVSFCLLQKLQPGNSPYICRRECPILLSLLSVLPQRLKALHPGQCTSVWDNSRTEGGCAHSSISAEAGRSPTVCVRPGEVGAVCSSFAEAPGLRKARILSTSQQAVSAEQCRSWNPRMAKLGRGLKDHSVLTPAMGWLPPTRPG